MEVSYVVLMTVFLTAAGAERTVYPNKQRQKTYDYIVVGSGSAGSVVASRLSENPNVSVLLLEAGGPPPTMNDIPYKCFFIEAQPGTDWMYFSEPQPNACFDFPDQKCLLSRFKGLGGCSSHNAMMYVRGGKGDFDNWAEAGATGWSYDEVLPFFKKSEDSKLGEVGEKDFHGTGGEITIAPPTYTTPLSEIFREAAKQNGETINDDYNGKSQLGFSPMQHNIRDGLRCGNEKAFLRPLLQRPNVDILINALVEKILFDQNNTARAVVFNQNGQSMTVNANKEIILSAGVFGSPEILLRSGVGPAEDLKELNITLIADLPVGKNLHDHPHVSRQVWKLNGNVSFNAARLINDQAVADLLVGEGPYTSPNGIDNIIFMTTKYQNQTDLADMMIVPVSTRFSLSSPVYPSEEEMSIVPLLMKPQSRGFLKLRSTNPTDPPIIDMRYLTDEMDFKRLLEALKYIRNMVATPALQQYSPTLVEKIPGCESMDEKSDEYLECAVRKGSLTTLHFVGTAKMGAYDDETAVVDSQLKVKGVKGLRVIDASVMPTIVSANTHAATVMIGEKGADMIIKSA